MAIRLSLFLAVLVVTIIIGVLIVLVMTGTLTAGLTNNESIIARHLNDISRNIAQEYGRLAVETINFPKELSHSIDEYVAQYGIAAAEIVDHPELLEDIISHAFEKVKLFLLTAKASGSFIILDATINPRLPGSENSRAGLYLKNMEPNIISASSPNITVFQGFPSVGRSNSLSLHSQWRLEFDITSAENYKNTIATAAANPNTSLSRLYYWSTLTLPQTSEKIMVCMAPLLDAGGRVYGVCGLEISEMLFKMSFMPNDPTFKRMFSALVPVSGETMELSAAMIAGGYSVRSITKDNITRISPIKRCALQLYRTDSQDSFIGLDTTVNMYPNNSVYADNQWAVAIFVPEEDIITSVIRLNHNLFGLLLLLFLFGILFSLLLSNKYLEPIQKGLALAKSVDHNNAPQTKVPEIDELIQFLNRHHKEIYEKALQKDLSFAILDEFIEKTKTLSPAERKVFNLYVKGCKAREIADKLFLSINTIKTHTKHIFVKLDIASRKELNLCIRMLKEIGKEINT